MKRFKFTKGIQITLITLFVIVIGIIIVGFVSNNKAMGYYGGQECENYETCGGTIHLFSHTDTTHAWMCNVCWEVLEENPCNFNDYSNPRAFTNNNETHSWYSLCTACGGLAPNAYTTGVCSDSNSDEVCDYCGGWTDNTGSSGGGGSGGGSGSGGSTGDDCTCNGSTSYYEDYRKIDETLHACYFVCNICGGEWYDADYIHEYSDYTDNGDGTHTTYCDEDCGASITESCNFVNGECTDCGAEEECDHVEETIERIEPTCTTAGRTEGKKCSLCGETTQSPTTIPATGHTEVDIEAVGATCTTAGSTAGKKCSVCNTVTVEPTTIAATGHTEVEIPAVAATCTEAGKTSGKKCSVCNTVIVEPTIVPALGHNYENGTCTGCGEKEPISEIEITSTTYKIDGDYILDIQPGTKASDLKSNITTNATEIKIYGNDEEVNDDTIIATGMTLELKNGDIRKIFTIIVKGDVNSDGVADFKDLVKINKARLNKITLEEMYFLAADVNEDKSIDIKDLSKINRFRLNKTTEL